MGKIERANEMIILLNSCFTITTKIVTVKKNIFGKELTRLIYFWKK